MARPKGEPTKLVRVYVADADWLTGASSTPAEALRELRGRRLEAAQRSSAPTTANAVAGRCSCKNPVLSKIVTNLCTTCGLLR